MKDVFVQRDDSKTLFGTITDKRYKLDVILQNIENETVNFDRGIHVEIIGDLQEHGKNDMKYY